MSTENAGSTISEVASPVYEKPLNGPDRAALIIGVFATTVLFYLFITVSILFLVFLLTIELALLIGAIRFGLAGVLIQTVQKHLHLTKLFFCSLWISKGVDFRIALKPASAPKLFALLEELSGQLKVTTPHEVSLEMNVGAWVRLNGYRRGAGTTILGIGYDLLAGLSVSEMESVLAHEMVHAKLVQRGFKKWMSKSLGRASTLANALATQAQIARQTKQSHHAIDLFLGSADWLARTMARLVATYSRQDEFEADCGAAQLCGTECMRSTLLKLPKLEAAASRLPWNERMFRLQMGGGFSQWLIDALHNNNSGSDSVHDHSLFDKYSTHPQLLDRVEALPTVEILREPDDSPAIGLLSSPDNLAEELMTEIQRVIAENERKDSKELKKWSRKIQKTRNIHPLKALGIFVILGGLFFGAAVLMAENYSPTLPAVLLTLTAIASGSACLYFCRHRERISLVMPEYARLLKGWEGRKDVTDIDAENKKLERELKARVSNEKSTAKKAHQHAIDCYDALTQCEYLRAHVAARLCLANDPKSIEGSLGFAIAAAALGQDNLAAQSINFVQNKVGLKGSSLEIGTAWFFLLSGDWGRAEAFLQQTLSQKKNDPTLLIVLAFCQSRRGKLQSAIVSARAACQTKPEKEHIKLLIELLLNGGYLHEAGKYLTQLESDINGDEELVFAMVRFNLLHRKIEDADAWTAFLQHNFTSAHILVRLGDAYELAQLNEKAFELYQLSLQKDHFPQALVGLGRLEKARNHKEAARAHLLSALNAQKKVGENGIGPLALFTDVINLLSTLQSPTQNCKAWTASFANNPSAGVLTNKSLMIYALDKETAKFYCHEILSAMQPDKAIPSPYWEEAPREQQPDGPVRPGVKFVLG